MISLQCTYTQVESDENETDRTRRDDTDTNNTMETDTSHNDSTVVTGSDMINAV